MFRAVKRSVGKNLEGAIDTSSYGTDYKCFSPFTYSTEFKIPVPGQENTNSYSVEGIWQGLKVINEQTDFSLFYKKPKKRRGQIEGHLLGSEILGLTEARKRIYAPSYFFYLEKHVPTEKKEEITGEALERGLITFYDVGKNLDIQAQGSLSHSVFLTEFFNDYFNQRIEGVKRQIDSLYEQQEFPNETLAEPLARTIEWNKSASPLNRKLLRHFLENYPISEERADSFKERYYKELLKRLNSD